MAGPIFQHDIGMVREEFLANLKGHTPGKSDLLITGTSSLQNLLKTEEFESCYHSTSAGLNAVLVKREESPDGEQKSECCPSIKTEVDPVDHCSVNEVISVPDKVRRSSRIENGGKYGQGDRFSVCINNKESGQKSQVKEESQLVVNPKWRDKNHSIKKENELQCEEKTVFYLDVGDEPSQLEPCSTVKLKHKETREESPTRKVWKTEVLYLKTEVDLGLSCSISAQDCDGDNESNLPMEGVTEPDEKPGNISNGHELVKNINQVLSENGKIDVVVADEISLWRKNKKVDRDEVIVQLMSGQALNENDERAVLLEELRNRINFSRPASLSHWDGFHSHTCLVCGYKTSVPYNMTKHLRLHTGDKPYSCPQCQYRSADSSSLASHMRGHTGVRPHKCPHCPMSFRSSTTQRNHVLTHIGVKPLQCPSCEYRCIEPNSMKTHIRTHTGEKPYACPHCDYRTNKQYNLKSHLRVHSGDKPYKCQLCDYQGSCVSSLILHKRSHTGEKPYSCEQCDYSCASGQRLKVHLRAHTGEKPYSCKICGHRSATHSRLKSHVKTHTGEKHLACALCEYKCARSDHLKAHILRVHSGEKPFACSDCDYRCAERAQLTMHIRRRHTGEKPYACKFCPFKSADSNGLRSHVKVHSPDKPLICAHCGFRTDRRGVLKNHVMTHTGDTPYSCPYCPYRAIKSCSLKMHISNHHNGEKKFHCLVTGCTYRAALPSSLKTHQVTHSKLRPYKCELCPYKGKQKASLKSHMSRVHGLSFSAPTFNCYHCPFYSFTQKKMEFHALEHIERSCQRIVH